MLKKIMMAVLCVAAGGNVFAGDGPSTPGRRTKNDNVPALQPRGFLGGRTPRVPRGPVVRALYPTVLPDEVELVEASLVDAVLDLTVPEDELDLSPDASLGEAVRLIEGVYNEIFLILNAGVSLEEIRLHQEINSRVVGMRHDLYEAVELVHRYQGSFPDDWELRIPPDLWPYWVELEKWCACVLGLRSYD